LGFYHRSHTTKNMKELDIIDRIRKRSGKPGKGLKLGIGDDCAVIKAPADSFILWAADMLVEGTHFNLKSAGYRRVGRKAVAVNISDIAAMGGEPLYVTVSIGLPRGTKAGAVDALYDGIFGICKEYGLAVAGGDTNRSERLVIDVSILGSAKNKKILTRAGAAEGDLVLITGPVRDGKRCHLDFEPRLRESRTLSGRYRVSSMIDTSDGIALDMARICSGSGTGCVLYEDAIPLSAGLSLKDALYYGESFELLFTMPPSEAKKLFRDMKRKKECPFFVIGEITPPTKGRTLIRREGRKEKLKAEGFKHL